LLILQINRPQHLAEPISFYFKLELSSAWQRTTIRASDDEEWILQAQVNREIELSTDGIQPDKGNDIISQVHELTPVRLAVAAGSR
jgi:hypothetical protein